MNTRYSARINWQLRVQRKVGADYLRGQAKPRRTAMIVAAVAAVHVVLLVGILSWHVEVRPMEMLVKVKIVPMTHVASARR